MVARLRRLCGDNTEGGSRPRGAFWGERGEGEGRARWGRGGELPVSLVRFHGVGFPKGGRMLVGCKP